MDIQLKTGEVYFKFPQDVGTALVALGFARKYEHPVHATPPPAAPPALKWVVGEHLTNGKITIVASIGDNSQSFDGRPKQATAAFKTRGFDLPYDILQRYVALRKNALETAKRDLAAMQGSKENGPDINIMLNMKIASLVDAGYGEDA